MPKKRKKLKLGLRHILPALIFVLVASSVAFYGTTKVKPSHADTGAYYSCNSGDTLSGSICTHKSTYNATASTNYTCPRGGTVSGSNCTYAAHTSNSTYYYCDSPATISGTTCSYAAPKTCGSGGTQISGNSCQAPVSCGYTFGGYKCQCYVGTQQGNYCYYPTYYYCPNGGTLNGSTCTYSAHSGTSTSYYCDGSDPRNGTTCSYGATSATAYSCNNGDALSGTTCTHTSTYAATYHPAVTGSSKTSSGTKSTNTPLTIAAAQPPSAPTGLSAQVVSSKVVTLSWMTGQAAAGVQNYEVERSLDNATWVPLGPVSNTSFTDTGTDFATKYYYRVREVDNAGADSGYATTTVTTGKFSSTGSQITSDDKLVTVSIPDGAFDQDVSCSVTSPDGSLPSVPTKSLLIGPYSILCVSEDGTTINNFKKPLKVTMDLSGASDGYGAVTATLYDNTNASDAKSTYDAKAHKISFELTANKSFAAYGKKQGIGFMPFLLLIVLLGGGIGAFYLRRYWAGRSNAAPQLEVPLATMPAAAAPAAATVATPAAPSAATFFEQAVNKPNCTHLSMAHQVQPQTSGCAECTVEHKKWKALRICLTCGHVGCSDDSDEQHALKHFQQTGHPLIYEYGNPKGDSIGWCYIDQTYI